MDIHNWGNKFLLSLFLILSRDSFKYESCRSQPTRWTPILTVSLYSYFYLVSFHIESGLAKKHGRSVISKARP